MACRHTSLVEYWSTLPHLKITLVFTRLQKASHCGRSPLDTRGLREI